MAEMQLCLVVLTALVTEWSRGSAAPLVWVVPDRLQCPQGSNGTCRTLIELQQPTSNPITQSGTTWVFLPGTHAAHSAVTAFVNASNVVLQCGKGGQERDCVISCPPDCVFTFVNCTNVTVQGLNVTASYKSYNNTLPVKCSGRLGFSDSSHFYCPSTRAWVLERVENANIRDVHFSNCQLAVLAPRGRMDVVRCSFTRFPPTATILESHSRTSPVAVHVMGPPPDRGILTVNIIKCTFERLHYFPKSREGKQFAQHAIKVTVHREVEANLTLAVTVANCVFLRGPAVDVNMTDKPKTTFRIRDCFLDGEANCSHGNCQGFPLLRAPGVRVQVTTGLVPCNLSAHQPRIRMNISGTVFTHLASYEGTGVSVRFSSANSSGVDPCCHLAEVGLHNNTFHHNWGLRYGSVVHVTHTVSGRGCPLTCSTKHPAFIMDGNIIYNNVAQSARCNEFEILAYSPGHSLYVSQQKRLEDCQPNDHGQGTVFLKGLQGPHFASYHNNSVHNNTARGLFLDRTQLVIWGPNHVINNSALFGGGLYLHHQSQLVFTANSSLNMSGNRAIISGGGIYVSDDCYKPDLSLNSTCHCFFELKPDDSNSTLPMLSPRVFASGNTAHTSGNLIYVSTMGQCNQSGLHPNVDSINLFHKLFHLPDELNMQQVASFPQKICLCNGSGPPNCSLSAMDTVQVYPGQKLSLYMQVLGDQNISLHTEIAVHAAKNEPQASLREFPQMFYSQILHQGCNSVLLPLWQGSSQLEPGKYTLLFAVPHHPPALTRNFNSFLIANLSVQLLHDCPPGFRLTTKHNETTCLCQESLPSRISCLLGNATISNPNDSVSFIIPHNYWLGQGPGGHIYYSNRCMPTFCNNNEEHNEVWLVRDSRQCLHNREGLLCGNCPKGKSVVFGSPQCFKCTHYTLLLIIVCAVFGPVLIGFLCLFNFTVSTRSINGLLFYISVVSINIDLFPLFSNRFASSVVALLNMDISFTCFYDGMTIKDRTLLSFAFPLYLLLLVALLIAVSRCVPMHKVNKLIGPRITPVLVTVIFLSHTKLFNSVVQSLLYTHIWDVSTGERKLVWQFDGTIPYFSSDHLVLAAISLVTLFGLLLPITVIAVAGDLLRRCIRNRWYMNFLDTFHGSFRFKLGFWIGLRLVLRMVLLLLKVSVSPEIVQLVTVCIVLTLAVVQSVLKPFRHLRLECFTHPRLERWCTEEVGRTIANTLDISFLVNLAALFVCLSYEQHYGEVFLTLSLLVVLLQLLLILLYHLLEYSPFGRPILHCLDRVAHLFKKKLKEEEEEGSFLVDDDVATRVSQLPLVLDPNECTDESYESSLGSTMNSTGLEDKTI